MSIAGMAVSSIASCGRSCRSLFAQLRTIWTSADPAATAKITLVSINTESDRYELWANNIAALQDAYLPTSLEYRIREDASARNVVEKALAYLEESLQLAFEIVSGERPNETWEETGPLDGKTGDTTTEVSSEIVELYLSIQEAITNLFRLSMIIRKKPERDEYAKAATRYKIDPTSDIVHVGDKYPTAKKSELPWLMKRFGISITQRRQYLLYRREHQQRMHEAHRLKAGPDGNTVWSGTKASTYLPDENAAKNPQEQVLPIGIIIEPSQKRPQTEYADSSKGKDGATDFLRTPPLPMRQDGSRVEYGEHFECPYCWRVQNMGNKNEWKKHVLSDLKPYVCTFQSCELNMFDSQHEWFTHELQFHRKQWICSFCRNRAPESRPDLIVHLDSDHQKDLKGQNADIFVDSCQVNRIDASECPLCEEYGEKLRKVNKSIKCDVTLKQFQHHLGVHMQQLALAALPQDNTEEGNDEVDSDVEAEGGAEILDEAIEPSNSRDENAKNAKSAMDALDVLAAEERASFQSLGLKRNMTGQDIIEAYSNSPVFTETPDKYKLAYAAEYDLKTSTNFPNHSESEDFIQSESDGPQDLLEVAKDADSETIPRVYKATKEESEGTKPKNIINNIINPVEKSDKPEPIRFKDAVGRKFSFPFNLCKKIDDMEDLIRQAFLHVEVLGPQVDAGRYDLVSSEGKIIERDQWENVVRPGLAITMHMWLAPSNGVVELEQSLSHQPTESLEESLLPNTTIAPSAVLHYQDGSRQAHGKKAKKAAKAAMLAKWDSDSGEDKKENKDNVGDVGDSGGVAGGAGDMEKDDNKGNGDNKDAIAEDQWDFVPAKSKKKGKKGRAHLETGPEPTPSITLTTCDDFQEINLDDGAPALDFSFSPLDTKTSGSSGGFGSWGTNWDTNTSNAWDFSSKTTAATDAKPKDTSIGNNPWRVNKTDDFKFDSLDEPESKEDPEGDRRAFPGPTTERRPKGDIQKGRPTRQQIIDDEILAKTRLMHLRGAASRRVEREKKDREREEREGEEKERKFRLGEEDITIFRY